MSNPLNDQPHREIALQGTSNLRDLGGMPTRNGQRTRFGRLYRSAKLSKLTGDDELRLAALGIRNVCDLRGTDERERDACVHLQGSQLHHLPMEAQLDQLLQDILSRRDVAPGDMADFINNAYENYPQDCAQPLRSLFALMLEDQNLPLLFHCAAGKDRTGFSAAVVLTAVGVEWASVLQDYLTTNQHWRRDFKLPHGLTEELGAPLLAATEDMLARSFKTIERRYGSFDAYLQDELGIDAPARLELERLLTCVPVNTAQA